MTNVLLWLILADLLYLTWRAKDSHWHSRAEWEMLRRIDRKAGDNR